MAALITILALSGCGTGHPPQLISNGTDPGRSTAATAPTDPHGQLVGLVAAAQDRRYIAAYTLVTRGRADRTVLVSLAGDASWRVDVPGAALSGGADVSIVGNSTGTYQCLLGGPATVPLSRLISTPSTVPTPVTYPAPACVKVAAAGKPVPARYDPVIEHFFTDWLDVLINRNAPISVFHATPLPRSTGACFSVEPSAASLVPPIDAGIYCFLPDGTLTAATIAGNSLVLSGLPATAPPTNPLPAPVIAGPAAPVKAPPVPVVTATPAATTTG